MPEFAGLTVSKANERKRTKGFCLVLYGPAGVGKTPLAAMAADSEYGAPVLFLDAEGGTISISHRDDIDVLDVTNWSSYTKVEDEVNRKGELPWNTIVLDNMSELQNVHMRSITAGVPEIQHYNANTSQMLRVTRFWRDISRIKGINVILIAWDSPEKDDFSGILKRDVGFTPSLARQFPGLVDTIGLLMVVDNPPHYTRLLSLAPSPRSAARFRRSQDDVALEIPYEIYFSLEDNPMADLLNTLKGGKPWPKDKYKAPPKRGT